eukprot:278570_1
MSAKYNYFECAEDVSKCSSLTILQKVLDQYCEWMNEDSPKSCSKYNIFDTNTILNHFHHLLICHTSDTDFDYIYKLLGGYKCDIKQCQMFDRNYRDKEKHKLDDNISIQIYNINTDQMNNLNDTYHQISIQQILDRVHCTFFHSYDIGFKFTLKEKEVINQCITKDTAQQHILDEIDEKHENNDNNIIIPKQTFLAKTQEILANKYKIARCDNEFNKFCTDFGAQSTLKDED